jgi:hypothetical protein
MSLDSFKEAFSARTSTMWTICACGEEFGEDDSNMLISRWYGLIEFEGKTYVEDCACWHKRAEMLIGWMNSHKQEIAKYLNAEKKRLTEFAERHPTVELDQ